MHDVSDLGQVVIYFNIPYFCGLVIEGCCVFYVSVVRVWLLSVGI